ncbi:MAG: PilT/PilU family type 4a pilus ATPase [Planctomycetes bacterium]|nr:PilT/PilU family type 4a pilus ATPase [Planctomycetota bacterium]
MQSPNQRSPDPDASEPRSGAPKTTWQDLLANSGRARPQEQQPLPNKIPLHAVPQAEPARPVARPTTPPPTFAPPRAAPSAPPTPAPSAPQTASASSAPATPSNAETSAMQRVLAEAPAPESAPLESPMSDTERGALEQRLAQTNISPRHQIEAWLAVMVKLGASDLILRAGGRPSTRVDGRIGFLPGRVPGPGALLEVLEGVVGRERMAAWRENGSVDAALQLDGLGRFRMNAYKQMGEPAIVLRRVSDQAPALDALELPTAELERLALRKRGMMLVTGIAGSGKSTTLSGMIQFMNTTSERHVVTLEDPIEMLFSEKRCVISQREIGIDVPNFHQGLRHALRQSPDVILIGEMRDRETVTAALDAAETGHLVMSTMHTVNAAQTLDRILGFYPAEQHKQIRTRLADNLCAVLSQRLLPRAEGRGMVPAFELMTSTPRIRELLENGDTGEIARTIDQGGSPGLISFNQSLRRLVHQKLVSLKDALGASDRPDELVLALRGITSGTSSRHPNAQNAEE